MQSTISQTRLTEVLCLSHQTLHNYRESYCRFGVISLLPDTAPVAVCRRSCCIALDRRPVPHGSVGADCDQQSRRSGPDCRIPAHDNRHAGRISDHQTRGGCENDGAGTHGQRLPQVRKLDTYHAGGQRIRLPYRGQRAMNRPVFL
jgi:hypothetical protein